MIVASVAGIRIGSARISTRFSGGRWRVGIADVSYRDFFDLNLVSKGVDSGAGIDGVFVVEAATAGVPLDKLNAHNDVGE